jgi:hypothetical protein
LSRALFEVSDYEGVRSLLSENSGFLALSDTLLSLFAWSLYWLGDLKQSSENLDKLKQKRDDGNDRSLTLSLAIASGDWNSLNILVETEWDRRENRTPEEVLRAGQLDRPPKRFALALHDAPLAHDIANPWRPDLYDVRP